MGKYAQIRAAYTTHTPFMLATLVGSIIALTLIVPQLLFNMLHIGSVALAVMIIALCGFFLGGHLKQLITTSASSLVPNFRKSHLLFAAALFLLPLSFYGVMGSASRFSVLGVTAIGMLAWVVAFDVGARKDHIGTIGSLILIAGVCVPETRTMGIDIMNGQLPILAVCLLSMEAAVTALLFHRLATLSGENYGMIMPLNVYDVRAATVRRRNLFQLQRSPRLLLLMLSSASQKLKLATAQPARTPGQRIALHRISADWPADNKLLVATVLIVELMMFAMSGKRITTEVQFSAALTTPIMNSLILGFVHWSSSITRWSRLGYESLRPATRQTWVRENAWALAYSSLQLQAIWVSSQLIMLLLFLRDYWSSPSILNALLFLSAIHLLAFGCFAWAASLEEATWKKACAMMIVIMLLSAWNELSPTAITLSWQVPVVAFVCGGAGLGMMGLAYRRWCRIDLS